MRSVLMCVVIGLATGFLSEKLLVASQISPTSDDLYLEGQSSGGFPSDDEDNEDNFSGSGSSEFSTAEVLKNDTNTTRFLDTTPVTREETWRTTNSPAPTQDASTAAYVQKVTGLEPTDGDGLAETLEPSPTDSLFPTGSPSDAPSDAPEPDTSTANYPLQDDLVPRGRSRVLGSGQDVQEDITSEDMWHRTEVLAAVIACGVVGFLCALFLVLLLAYRMKKKDEGSYALGVAKIPLSAYHKEPAKEFYA
ncbi:hypothetical protein NHX12_000746 [Muraenolepis orangiensis]|uniref:Syndecan n=1 Tax=Muraenolepis orangiensis TaxID=630683 RepID=A0A9Q0DYP5_9TELE|nr:hypothetical protein NHX12_000746 [Muraenolepis orangiensis]